MLVLVFLVVITLVSPRYHSPHGHVNVGPAVDYTVGEPQYFEERALLGGRSCRVRRDLALYDRDPITGCTVPWDPTTSSWA